MTVICKVTAPCSARVLGQLRPTMLCIHLVKWLVLLAHSLLSAFFLAVSCYRHMHITSSTCGLRSTKFLFSTMSCVGEEIQYFYP